jgi:hypothetical protein
MRWLIGIDLFLFALVCVLTLVALTKDLHRGVLDSTFNLWGWIVFLTAAIIGLWGLVNGWGI